MDTPKIQGGWALLPHPKPKNGRPFWPPVSVEVGSFGISATQFRHMGSWKWALFLGAGSFWEKHECVQSRALKRKLAKTIRTSQPNSLAMGLLLCPTMHKTLPKSQPLPVNPRTFAMPGFCQPSRCSRSSRPVTTVSCRPALVPSWLRKKLLRCLRSHQLPRPASFNFSSIRIHCCSLNDRKKAWR